MPSQIVSLFFALVILGTGSLYSYEIAMVQGEPDESIEFVRNMVYKKVKLFSGKPEQFSTTEAYSIFHDLKIENTAIITILDEYATISNELFFKGLEVASLFAPVVYTSVIPISNEVCLILAKHTDTAFVVVSGNYMEERLASQYPACSAGNILMTAALDQMREELLPFSDWGSQVRIAAPCHNIDVIVPGGAHEVNTNSTIGSSMVAARLAVLAKQHPSSRGSVLINRFLQENTVFLPRLLGKVKNGLALKYKID